MIAFRTPTSRLRASAFAALLACSLAATAGTMPKAGDPAPTFVGMNRDDEPVALDDYGGKVIVVTFWASWCPPCMKEMPILEAIQRRAGHGQLQVIAINIEATDVFRAITRRLAGFDLTLTRDAAGRASQAYGVHGIPHMVIVGRDGRIVRVNRGYTERELDHVIADVNTALVAP